MIGRLKRRAEFLQVAAANRKWVAPGLILQVRRQPSTESESDDAPRAAELEPVRVGFTASRKVGNAVVRHRLKRRIKETYRRWQDRAQLPPLDLIVHLKPEAGAVGAQAFRSELLRLLSGILPKREPAG